MINPYYLPGIEIVNLNTIEAISLNRLKLTPIQVREQTRKAPLVIYRQIVMYMLDKYTNMSLCAIARLYKKKNHATVIHACRSVQNLIDTKDWDYYNLIKDIEEEINTHIKSLYDGQNKTTNLN